MNSIVKEHFPVSAQLGGLAMLLAIVVGVPLGILAALRANSVIDYLLMLFANLGFAVPSFLVATLFIYFFAAKWGLFPTNGWDSWSSKVLPVVALSLGPLTYFARIVRGQMLETLQQDYVRTARAKGLRWKRVVTVHVLRNSLIPAVTAAGPLLGFLVTGSFIIENIFAIPGIGRYYVTSVSGRDYSTVMGITVLLAILIIVANLVVDILYGYLDPRTREQRTSSADGPEPAGRGATRDGRRPRGRGAALRGRCRAASVEPLARRAAALHAQPRGAHRHGRVPDHAALRRHHTVGRALRPERRRLLRLVPDADLGAPVRNGSVRARPLPADGARWTDLDRDRLRGDDRDHGHRHPLRRRSRGSSAAGSTTQ